MSKNSKEGIVYIVQNPAFPHLFKIGWTVQETVEDRGLNASNVPEDFDVLFGYECNSNDPKKVEEHLHEICKEFRHYTKTGRKTEFFYVCCLQRAKDALKFLEEAGAREISGDDISLGIYDRSEYDETKDIESIKKKSPLFTFGKVNIKPETILVFTENEKEECKVVSSKDDRTVLYKDKKYNLSPLAQELRGNNKACRGIRYFKVKGEKETLEEKFDKQT